MCLTTRIKLAAISIFVIIIGIGISAIAIAYMHSTVNEQVGNNDKAGTVQTQDEPPMIAVVDTEEKKSSWLITKCTRYGLNVQWVPPEKANPKEYDAVIIPGGGCVTPSIYGQEKDSRTYDCDIEKDRAQIKVVLDFAGAGKPVMGICRGAQVINVAFGGTLNQYIEGHTDGASTETVITSDAWLYPVYGSENTVACYHQQCVDKLAEGFKITQRSKKDGYAEFFEHESLPIYAVQYHPENMGQNGKQLLQWFNKSVEVNRKIMKKSNMYPQ